MTEERMFEIMGKISDEYVSEASEVKKVRKTGWIKWTAVAASLALAVGIGTALYPKMTHDLLPVPGLGDGYLGGITPGGNSEGGNYSVAVLPAGVSKEDVAEAVVLRLTETEARAVESLGGWIPAESPAGLNLAGVSEYRTTMKDGTVYRMLRVNYTNGEVIPGLIDGDTGEKLEDHYVVTFSLSLWDFRPDTEDTVYSPAEATAELFRENEDTVHLDLGDVYVSLHPGGQTPEELAEIVSIFIK